MHKSGHAFAGNGPIPAIGCGTWELRGETCAKIVAEALRVGYRHIDTAQGYGNEEAVGEGHPRLRNSPLRRVRHDEGSPAACRGGRPAAIRRGEPPKLQVDAVDLLLIHWPNPAVPVREMMSALSDAKRRGLTRHIGVSNFTIAKLDEAVAVSPEPIVTNQIELHPYLDQTRLLGEARRLGLTITAYCPIALGKVVGRSRPRGHRKALTASRRCRSRCDG